MIEVDLAPPPVEARRGDAAGAPRLVGDALVLHEVRELLLAAIDALPPRLRLHKRLQKATSPDGLVDVIEVLNSRTVFTGDNERSRRLAEQHGKLMSASSDSHTPWEIGCAYTEMPSFEGAGDFLLALGQGRVMGGRSFVGFHFLSTWAKVRWRLRLGKRLAK